MTYMQLGDWADSIYPMLPSNGGWSDDGVGKGSLTFSFEVKDNNTTYFNLGATGNVSDPTSGWGWRINVYLNSTSGTNRYDGGTELQIYNLSDGVHEYEMVWDNNEQTHYIDQISVIDSTADTTTVRGINFFVLGDVWGSSYWYDIVIKDLVQGKTVTITFSNYPTVLNQTVPEYLMDQGLEGWNSVADLNNITIYVPPPPPPPNLSPPICFPQGTPVLTNLGPVAIEKLNPDKHTIRGHNIVAITQSRPLQKHIVCFEKDALSKNVPSQQTLCSMEHKVFYKGEMTKARNLVDLCENVTFVPYNGETLFNVLLKKHDKMMINNLICETLHPENIAAKISTMNNGQKKNKAIQELSKIIKENNVPEYQKLYDSL